jgi:indole-3-glycerol phosphate synthase
MSILSQIVATKTQEVLDLQKTNFITKSNITKSQKPIIIAEIKPKSPSVGSIYEDLGNIENLANLVKEFENIGASGISVLTDETYFGGSTSLLQNTKNLTNLPILRKDFIISTEQIYQTKSIGADLILLIVKILTPNQLLEFTKLSLELHLQPLIEINDEAEAKILRECLSKIDSKTLYYENIIVAVNNRNLETLEMDINTSKNLFNLLPDSFLKFSLSGITTKQDLEFIINIGYDGVLIGTGLAQNIEFIKS